MTDTLRAKACKGLHQFNGSVTQSSDTSPKTYGPARWFRLIDGEIFQRPPKGYRCINNPTVDPAKYEICFCKRWNCPIHGFRQRERLLKELLAKLPLNQDCATFVIHLNRRLPVTEVSDRWRKAKRAIRRAMPNSTIICLPHYENDKPECRPLVHFHLVVFSDIEISETIKQQVVTYLLNLEIGKVMPWVPAGTPEGLLTYLFRVREQDRWLTLEKLPQSGGRYRPKYEAISVSNRSQTKVIHESIIF